MQTRACSLLMPSIVLYKILFCHEDFVHESIIMSIPPPTCIARTLAILLHVYCAIYDAPSTPLLHAIHHKRLVITISCIDQNRLAWPHRRRELASDGVRYADTRSSVGRQGSERRETKVIMVWGRFLVAAAVLKTPTRNCYTA